MTKTGLGVRELKFFFTFIASLLGWWEFAIFAYIALFNIFASNKSKMAKKDSF